VRVGFCTRAGWILFLAGVELAQAWLWSEGSGEKSWRLDLECTLGLEWDGGLRLGFIDGFSC
jgi:hypothetical protein